MFYLKYLQSKVDVTHIMYYFYFNFCDQFLVALIKIQKQIFSVKNYQKHLVTAICWDPHNLYLREGIYI